MGEIMKQNTTNMALEDLFNDQMKTSQKLSEIIEYIKEKENQYKNISLKATTTSVASSIMSPMLGLATLLTYAIEPNYLAESPETFLNMGALTTAGIIASIVSGAISKKYTKKQNDLKCIRNCLQEGITSTQTVEEAQKILKEEGTKNPETLSKLNEILSPKTPHYVDPQNLVQDIEM